MCGDENGRGNELVWSQMMVVEGLGTARKADLLDGLLERQGMLVGECGGDRQV